MRESESLTESRERVVRIAREALAGAFGGVEEVPAALVDAIARSVGDRQAVASLGRRKWGEEPPLALVLFDTDQIASYVFESSRPPVLAGASKILSDLNRQIRDDYEQAALFSGGGEGLLLVPRARADEVRADVESRFARATGGALTVSTATLEVWPHDFIGVGELGEAVSGTRAVLARLRDRIRHQKDERLPAGVPVAGSRPRCVSCRDRAAGATPIARYRDEKGRLCDSCDLRWLKGKGLIHGTSFDDILADFQAALPGDGPPGARAAYLGFVYADGNSMGTLFGQLSTLTELRFLSLAVSGIFERVEERAQAEVQAFLGKSEDADLPFLSFLGGGDEAIWILPGALAVRTAELLPTWIAEESACFPDLPSLLARAKLTRLTAGVGVVLSGPGYPVRYQYELAKELLKSAKSLFYEAPQGAAESSLDFALLTDSSPLSEDLAAARALALVTEEEGFLRSLRPYTADGFRQLLGRIRQAFAQREEGALPLSQLYALEAGVGEGSAVFLNLLRYQIARPPAGARYQAWLKATGCDPADPAALAELFVRPAAGGVATGTWIADLVELAPFVDLYESRRPVRQEVA